MGLLGELFLYLFMELYVELAYSFIPKEKFKQWHRILLYIICGFVMLGIVCLIVLGACMLSYPENKELKTGLVCLCVGVSLFLIHIFIMLILKLKKNKQKINIED